METAVLLGILAAFFQAGSCVTPEKEWEKNVGMTPGKYPKGMSRFGPEWGASIPENYPDNLVQPDIPIFPPKFNPGEVVELMEFNEINDALDDVMRSGDLMHDRRCALSISNEAGAILTNPQWYFSSGGTHSSPGYEITTDYTGLNLFLKTPWALRGSVGIVTYDIVDTEYKLAVFWHVPFDRNLYNNLFNFKIYPRSFVTDDDMYDQMYYYAGPWLAQGWQERNEYGIELRGVMTDNVHSKVSVWINTLNHQPDGQPELWTDCSYHAGWIGRYCWRECYPRGWCWVDKKCSSRNDCLDLPQECHSDCKKA